MHLWIVGGPLALLWNAVGCYDSSDDPNAQHTDYLKSMMPDVDPQATLAAYVDGFPIWASIGWGSGCGSASPARSCC